MQVIKSCIDEFKWKLAPYLPGMPKSIIPLPFWWPSVPPFVLTLGSSPQFLASILTRQLLPSQILPVNKLQSLNKCKVTAIQTTWKMNTSLYKHTMRAFEILLKDRKLMQLNISETKFSYKKEGEQKCPCY